MDEATRLFHAPVPGQGLTKPLGSTPWQQPPQYTDPDKALQFVWQSLTSPRNAFKMCKLLETKEISCEMVANTVLFSGFQKGLWTPTLIILMSRTVLGMIVAVAHKNGVKDFKIFNKRDDMSKFIKQINDITSKSKGKLKTTNKLGGILDSNNQQNNDTQSPNQGAIGGIMAAGMN